MTTQRLLPSRVLTTVITDSLSPAQLNNGCRFFLPPPSPSPSQAETSAAPVLAKAKSTSSPASSGTVSATPTRTVRTQTAWQRETTLSVVSRSDTSCRTPASREPRNMPRKLLASRRPRRDVRWSVSLVSDTWLRAHIETDSVTDTDTLAG